jgi:serine phosphatase RsbU (regulator of sigma subunit)
MMMRKLMDDIQYSVTENGNEFRLTKYREATHESRISQYWNALTMRTKYSVITSIILTILFFTFFGFFYFNVQGDVQDEVIQQAATGCRSLADNTIDNLIRNNDLALFEDVRVIRKNNENIIRDAFIVRPDSQLAAHSTPAKMLEMGVYAPPTDKTFLDSLGKVAITKYFQGDTLELFDFNCQIRQSLSGEGAVLGYAHVLVEQNRLDEIAASRKLRISIYMLIVLIIGYIGAYFLIYRIITPFHSLADWVRQVVIGKIDQDEIDIDASDELGEIAQAFNEMTDKFRKAQVNLMEQQKLQKELQVAQEIQQMLLPSDFPSVEGFEIASYYEAAKEVGGDLFDFVEVDADTLGICVADVSGKGVPGSLIMTMIRTALRLESRDNHDPADVLARVNRFVTDDMKRGMFVTMFYVVIDSRNRVIHYASAGHNPMILYRPSSHQTYYLNPSGFPVGIQLPDIKLFDQKIETDSIRLKEDDILVLYTDGITEAMNVKRELFREERFLDSIRRNGHYDVTEFVKSIKEDLKNFTGGAIQNDDITFVSIKEKLMPGEVLYKIHKEMHDLISEGMTVKEASEQMRISPYHFYKFKSIVEEGGLEGLKEYLAGKDTVKKKHLSIETKTKMFDIIGNHPEYGAKSIANHLNTETYGFEKVDERLIYNELAKLRLTKREQRERWINKSDRMKRLKQPGTPLLTLDGQVILNFESSEDEIAKRHAPVENQFMQQQSERKETFVREIGPKPKPEETEKADEKAPEREPVKEEPPKVDARKADITGAVSIKAKPTVPEKKQAPERIEKKPSAPGPQKPAARKPEPKKAEAKPRPAPKSKAKPTKPKQKPSPRPKTAKQKPLEPEIRPPHIPVTREELLRQVSRKIEPDIIEDLYHSIADDIKAISILEENLEKSKNLDNDLRKINLILKIMLKNPILGNVADVKQIFRQVHHMITLIEKHDGSLDKELIITNLKDILKYIQKDNILKNVNRLVELINEIGVKYHRLSGKLTQPVGTPVNEIDRIRQKLEESKIFSNSHLLETITKNNKD